MSADGGFVRPSCEAVANENVPIVAFAAGIGMGSSFFATASVSLAPVPFRTCVVAETAQRVVVQ